MKFDGKIIVSDMDGTFLGSAEGIERNIAAIEYFKENGGRFTFATGRIHFNIKAACAQYEHVCNAPAITANGACIYDIENDTIVKEILIDPRLAAEIVEYMCELAPDVGVRCSTDRGFLMNRLVGLVAEEMTHVPSEAIVDVKPCSEWKNEHIYKIVCRVPGEQREYIRERVEARFGNRLTYSTSSPTFYEINMCGCTKADGVDFLRDMYSVDGKRAMVYAIGDYENDIQMLEAADFAACPDNALDAVKSLCDKTFCHCRDGAVADLINYIDSAVNDI